MGGDFGGREASGVEENPGGGRHGVGRGVESSQDDSTCHGEGGGVKSSQDDSTPNGRGGGVKSWQDDSTPNGIGGGVELSQDDSTPREAEGTWGDETPGSLTASRHQPGEDRRGRGGGDENPPTARATRGKCPNGGDGAARRGRTAAPDKAMETAVGDGGVGYPPEHFDGADGATTENGKRPRREYDKVV